MIVSSFVLVISAILTISHRSVGFKDQNTCMLYLIAGEKERQKERERDKKKERERREREKKRKIKRKIKRKEREIKRKSGKKR